MVLRYLDTYRRGGGGRGARGEKNASEASVERAEGEYLTCSLSIDITSYESTNIYQMMDEVVQYDYYNYHTNPAMFGMFGIP